MTIQIIDEVNTLKIDIIYKEGICVCKDIAVSILFVH